MYRPIHGPAIAAVSSTTRTFASAAVTPSDHSPSRERGAVAGGEAELAAVDLVVVLAHPRRGPGEAPRRLGQPIRRPRVAERAEVGEEREALFAVTIPEEHGSFRRLCELIGARSVTEFNYRISDANQAHVFVGLATSNRGESAKIARSFDKHGFANVDLTDDELAKQHVRHMVGGRSELARDERLYRFVFPERPGALMRFLSSMHPDWNISLFHYRNQGADYGRILVGIQVPRGDKKAFKEFLEGLAYPCVDETDNPVYRLFLR